MKNDNDLILERMRGAPMQKGTLKDKFDPRNPNVPNANDNSSPAMIDKYVKEASESRSREIEAAIHRFRDCGVEIARFSIEEHPDETRLCIDGVPRFSWRFTPGHGQ